MIFKSKEQASLKEFNILELEALIDRISSVSFDFEDMEDIEACISLIQSDRKSVIILKELLLVTCEDSYDKGIFDDRIPKYFNFLKESIEA